MKYVLLLPLFVLGCGFADSPLPADHYGLDADDVVHVFDNDGGVFVGLGEAGSGGRPGKTHKPPADASDPPVSVDADSPEPDAAIVPEPDAGQLKPDAAQPEPDASMPPDASQPEPDAAQPPDPDYTDERICQPCGAGCGPQSVCSSGYCLPKKVPGKSCGSVCRGYLSIEGSDHCGAPDVAAACVLVSTTHACWI